MFWKKDILNITDVVDLAERGYTKLLYIKVII